MPPPDALRQRSFNGRAPQRELDLESARALVLETVAGQRGATAVDLEFAAGLVLAEPVLADRDLPPFPRSLRDGYAIRAADSSAPLRCLGQIRAGAASTLRVEPGACVEIMTGAAVPPGADAVAMVERTARGGDTVSVLEPAAAGDNIAAAGSDAARGSVVVSAGRRLDYAALAALASVGCVRPVVFLPPRVEIVSTGDELVDAAAVPGPLRIRNASGPALAAMARRAGAEPRLTPPVPDTAAAIESAIDAALSDSDLMLFTGGASVGAYDLVGPALAARGAEFYFDAVRIRPGRPVLFGKLNGHLFFGLPGNPLGSMLAFALLVRPAIDLLAGVAPNAVAPTLVTARLGFDYRGRAIPLTALRPARLRANTIAAEVLDLPYRGSADLVAAAAADGFWVVPPGISELPAGSPVQLLPK